MKSKDKKELHSKSIKELSNLVAGAKDVLAGLKLDKTQNKLKNTSQLTGKRKEIAQMLTVIRMKELQEEMEGKNEKTKK
ncbi:MAG: ribosomal protein [Candidatus Levybacteria bacterium]|nr:ribosomal protein [Candidatus Levybacteria bacterium]